MACYKTVPDSSDDISLTPPTDEKSLVSGLLQPSVPMQAVLWEQQRWQTFSEKSLCRFKHTKGLSFTIYGEFQSQRSLSHNFLRDSCPQMCAGSQPLHFRLWYSSFNYSYHFTKTVQTDVLGYEPCQLGNHIIPYPELHCAHSCYRYSSSHIGWSRQTAPGDASETIATATPAMAQISLHALDSCA